MEYTNRELLREGQERLRAAGIAEADVDAWILFAGTTGLDRTAYFMQGNEKVQPELAERYFEKIGRRTDREPVQYIEGTAPFMGYDFEVDENVLIPRMDTEILVAEAVKAGTKLCRERIHGTSVRVLDMCTGSGCIIESLYLSLKKDGYLIEACAADISEKALEVAEKNAERLGADVKFFKGNLFEKVDGAFNMILSNPPYIRSDVIAGLEPEVKDYEPKTALDGMQDGLYFYREITEHAGEYLIDGGILMLEIGYDQGMEVSRMCRDNGYTDIKIIKDFAGLDRVVSAVYTRH